MKNTYLVLFFGFVFNQLSAQQLPLFSLYRSNHAFLNPAAINSDFFLYEHNVSFSSTFRRQWTNIEGAPENMNFNFEYIYNNKKKRSRGALVLGLSGGILQYRINVDELNAKEPRKLPDFPDARIYPDLGYGLFYYRRIKNGKLNGDNIYVGFSSPRTFGPDLSFRNDADGANIVRIYHYYTTLGWYHYLNQDSFFEPSVWLKYVPGRTFHADFNFRFQLSSVFWAGVGVSTVRAFNTEVGLLVGEDFGWNSNIKIAYSFGYSFAAYGELFGTTHEINVAYTIDALGRY